MSTIRSKEKLKRELQDKEIRDFFVSDHINIGIPFQVKTLREQREWTQKELAQRAGMKQERISAIENINYKNAFTLSTLVRLASAFDVALIVRFAPISELVEWELALSPESLKAVGFDEDLYFRGGAERAQQEYNAAYSRPKPPVYCHIPSGGFVLGGGGMANFINPSQPSPPSQPSKTKPRDELGNYREAKQKKMESQLSKHLAGMEKTNETALG